MKPFLKTLFTPLRAMLAVVCAALAVAVAVPVPATYAATPNISVASGSVVVIPLHISGQYTASTTAVARFAMPFPCRVIGVGASARASGGTTPTLTVDMLVGGTTILSSAISVTAGAYAEGTISTPVVADEAAVTFNLTIGGTSPTWNDITVLVTVVRE